MRIPIIDVHIVREKRLNILLESQRQKAKAEQNYYDTQMLRVAEENLIAYVERYGSLKKN